MCVCVFVCGRVCLLVPATYSVLTFGRSGGIFTGRHIFRSLFEGLFKAEARIWFGFMVRVRG